GASVSPRDVVAACLPDPATSGNKLTALPPPGPGRTGSAPEDARGEVFLHPLAANPWPMAEYGSRPGVCEPPFNPHWRLDRMDSGAWSGTGVLGPEALSPGPFLDLLTGYGSPWACEERTPSGQ